MYASWLNWFQLSVTNDPPSSRVRNTFVVHRVDTSTQPFKRLHPLGGLRSFRSSRPHASKSTTMSSTSPESLVQQLSGFSTCEISDALIKLGSPNGGHIPDIQLVSPSGSNYTICGPAYTVEMVFTSDTSAPKLSLHFIDTAPAGTVIVINAPPSSVRSSWNVIPKLTSPPL